VLSCFFIFGLPFRFLSEPQPIQDDRQQGGGETDGGLRGFGGESGRRCVRRRRRKPGRLAQLGADGLANRVRDRFGGVDRVDFLFLRDRQGDACQFLDVGFAERDGLQLVGHSRPGLFVDHASGSFPVS